MKPIPPAPAPHDPLDELLAAALYGELNAAQQAELDALFKNDPAAHAAYQETLAMHDLLERTHREAQPDAAFEDRLISRVRQKTREEKYRETAWESAVFLWRGLGALLRKPSWKAYVGATAVVLILAGVALGPITNGIPKSRVFASSRMMGDFQQSASVQSQNDVNRGRTIDHQPAFAAVEPTAVPILQTLNAPTVSRPLFVANSSPTAALALPMSTPTSSLVVDEGATADAPVNAPPRPQLQTQLVDAMKSVDAQSPLPVDKARTYQFAGLPQGNTAIANAAPVAAAAQPSRKLVRNAQLDLQVKSYQTALDAITLLVKADGGYLDSSNSQRGGNGKLQGTLVVKVLPENLDAFLLKLRELGEMKNQSVSTEDVTKDYYDTQARLDNSRRMETQLQQLLAHDNGKVSDLLQVERELGRVRGEIEQMQGQLKLYDFQVQYATVTINLAEKDLHQAAAYLLKENDQFSLFTGNVEDAFAQAKAAAGTFKAQILNANLQHDSDNTLSATLAFSVPPEQIDGFLAQVKSLGRVDNFTRQTQRVANDGGDPGDPSDQTRTEQDHAQVQLTIRADDESPRQTTQLTIASTGDIDAEAQTLKDGAARSGATVIASNFERATDGTETATLSFRLPLAKVGDLMPALQKLGRVESLAVQRNDRPDQAAADPGAPAEIDLRLHNMPAVRFEDQTPRQQSQLAVVSTGNVDAQAQQLKADAVRANYAVTASTFNRSPDGTEQAALTFRLPLAQAATFTATLEKLGKVESLAVQRNDVTGPDSIDPNAPAEISLDLHSEPAIVAENHGFWATVRNTFGGGIAAFLGSAQEIGVLIAYLLPWAVVLLGVAWTARRVYLAARARQGAA